MAKSVAAPRDACVKKMDFQPNHTSRYPPMKGEISGETPSTSTSIEKMRRRSAGGKRSRTMARETTAPPQAPIACSKRKKASTFTDFDSAQATDEITNST